MKRKTGVLGILVAGLWSGMAASPAASNSLLTNGGFESPPGVATYSCFGAGAQLPGWTIESGTVDVVGKYWKAAGGSQSLDLNGIFEQIGTISQEVPTAPGRHYKIRFAFAGNPEGGPVTKTIRISWGAEELGTLSFDTTGCDFAHMNYTYHEYIVTAVSSTSRLRVQSLTPSFCGPVLDDLSVSQVSGSAPTLAERIAAVTRGTRGTGSSQTAAPASLPAAVATAVSPGPIRVEGSEAPATLQLNLYPVLTVFGAVGQSYRIESANDLLRPEWVARTNLVLTSSPCLWVDAESPNATSRFHRAVRLE